MNRTEMKDLTISWITISFAFAWVLSNFNLIGIVRNTGADVGTFIQMMPIALIATGTGFIFHELAHRTVAKKFGAHAEYRMWPHMLAVAAIFSLVMGVVFAAPGAVYIYGKQITRKQNGIISLAGPAANIILAIVFFTAYLFTSNAYLAKVFFITMYVNGFLAFFNLLPVWQLDGSKVFKWNPLIWAVFFIPLLFIFFL
jgi:Zn-dependent protease